jgi:hypothetical protein
VRLGFRRIEGVDRAGAVGMENVISMNVNFESEGENHVK